MAVVVDHKAVDLLVDKETVLLVGQVDKEIVPLVDKEIALLADTATVLLVDKEPVLQLVLVGTATVHRMVEDSGEQDYTLAGRILQMVVVGNPKINKKIITTG